MLKAGPVAPKLKIIFAMSVVTGFEKTSGRPKSTSLAKENDV
jgi:hypothetical protein